MPRKKRKILQRELAPDFGYNSTLVTKFINCMMWDGKRSIAQRIFYKALERIKEKLPDKEPIEVFNHND